MLSSGFSPCSPFSGRPSGLAQCVCCPCARVGLCARPGAVFARRLARRLAARALSRPPGRFRTARRFWARLAPAPSVGQLSFFV